MFSPLFVAQDTEEVEVSVIVPESTAKADVKVPSSTNGSSCQVQFQSKSLKAFLFSFFLLSFSPEVLHSGKTLVEGALASPCCPEGCTWTLSKGHVVVAASVTFSFRLQINVFYFSEVTLEKASPKPWRSLFAA